MRVLIVDDERLARARLLALLGRLPGVGPVCEAASAAEATEQIARFEPDVMLLDIHMPGPSGVELARSLPGSLGIVFVTADPGRALDAFEVGAYDYLLKPVQLDRLDSALQRAFGRRSATLRRLLCRGRSGIRLFDAEQIPRFRSEDKYTVFHAEGQDFLIEDSLDGLEQQLPHARVHRSELVDLRQVVAIEPGVLVLRDGQRARVSRRRWGAVRRALVQLGRDPATRAGSDSAG